jgi:hypothetical protein
LQQQATKSNEYTGYLLQFPAPVVDKLCLTAAPPVGSKETMIADTYWLALVPE